jgi:hypothetical protein
MAYKFNPFTGDIYLDKDTITSIPDPLVVDNLTVNSLLEAEHIHGNIAGTVYVHIKNLDSSPLVKGTPFYISGTVGSSDRVEVKAADASDPTKGPVIGLVEETLQVNEEGNGVILGEIFKYNTLGAGWSVNDSIYVAVGGGLTNVEPTSGYKQIVGYAGRIDSQTGTIIVSGNRPEPETFSGDYADLTNAPTALSEFTNDVGFGTSNFSGDYADLTNAPTALSEFTNDAGFTTESYVDSSIPASYQYNVKLSNNILSSPTGIGSTILSLPSTTGKQYIIHSIYVSNVSSANEEVNIIGAFDFNGGEISYFAYNIPISEGTGFELLEQPQILNPSDEIILRSTDINRDGADDIIDVSITYQEETSSDYLGIGLGDTGLSTTSPTTIYTSSPSPSVIQSIRLVNVTDAGAKVASVLINDGVRDTYLVKNLIVPKYSSVEIIDVPKYLSLNTIIEITLEEGASIHAQISGKKITS